MQRKSIREPKRCLRFRLGIAVVVETPQQGHASYVFAILGTLGFLRKRYPRHEPAGLAQRDATAAEGEDGFRFGCSRSAVPKLQTKCDW